MQKSGSTLGNNMDLCCQRVRRGPMHGQHCLVAEGRGQRNSVTIGPITWRCIFGCSTVCASACRGVTSWRTKALTDLSQVPMVVREPSKQNLLHNIFMYIARDNTFSLSKLICNDFNRPYTMVIARARHADKPRTCKD